MSSGKIVAMVIGITSVVALGMGWKLITAFLNVRPEGIRILSEKSK